MSSAEFEPLIEDGTGGGGGGGVDDDGDLGESIPLALAYDPETFLANIKQEVEESVQENDDYEDHEALNHEETEMDSSVKSEVEDIEEDNQENSDYFFESPAENLESSSSSENLSDDSSEMSDTSLPNDDPIPVILPPESITALLESHDIIDPNPVIVGYLGNAALQQLKQIILVASQVAFHNKASGIRAPDFTFAEKHLNNTPYDNVHGSAVVFSEEPEYELSSSGLPVPGQGPIIDLETQTRSLEGWLEGPEQLRKPSPPTMVSVQRITFHSYQEEEDSDEDSDEEGSIDCNSDSDSDSDSEKRDNDVGLVEVQEDQEKSDSPFDLLVSQEDDEDTFESATSANSDAENGGGLQAFSISEYYGQLNGVEEVSTEEEEEVQEGLELETTDTMEHEIEGGQEEDARGDDDEEETLEETTSSPAEVIVDAAVVDVIEKQMDLLAGLEDALSELRKVFDTTDGDLSTTEHDENSEESPPSTLSGSEGEDEENLDQDQEDQDHDIQVDAEAGVEEEESEADVAAQDVTVEENMAVQNSVEASEAEPGTTGELHETSAPIEDDNVNTEDIEEILVHQIEEEENENEDELEVKNVEMEVEEEEVEIEVESDAEASEQSEGADEGQEAEEASNSSIEEEVEEPGRESEEEMEDETSLVWTDYMKVLMEEFMALGEAKDEDKSLSAQQLSRLQDAREAETSEFSLFVEDIAKHGFLPMITVWCDFCKDFLRCKISPAVSLAHLNGMLSLFEAILKNRVSECISQKQMKQILIVLIEMAYSAPPWDIHRRLVAIFGLVLKSIEEDLLLEISSWICSFVSETFNWFVNSVSWLGGWDQNCRMLNIALRIVNELEQQGLHFIDEFKWHRFVTDVIRACDALASLRRLAVDRLKLEDLQRVEVRDKRSSSSANPNNAEAVEGSEQAVKAGESKIVSKAAPEPEAAKAKVEDGDSPEKLEPPRHPAQTPKDKESVPARKPESENTSTTADEQVQPLQPCVTEAEGNSSPAHVTCEDEEDEEPFALLHTSLTGHTILDLLENKTLAEKLKTKLSDLETEATPGKGSSSEKLYLSELPFLGHEFVHQDMENGILLFLKAFLRNYSSIVPETELTETQRLAASYFGDRANQLVRSSQMLELEYPKAKRRKFEKESSRCKSQLKIA